MDYDAFKIQELLQKRANYDANLKLIPYSGTPEIKVTESGKYLYVRKRVAGKLTSTYVDKYSDELYAQLLSFSRRERELNKQIRRVNKQLNALGYLSKTIPLRVATNLDFARINLKANIYDQAVLEGVATTFPQTETIIDNGFVQGVTASDIQKILNLKHAWEFILDKDVLTAPSNFNLLCNVAKLVNEGFYYNGGSVRIVPVSIGGSSYVPPIPSEYEIKKQIDSITADVVADDMATDSGATGVSADGESSKISKASGIRAGDMATDSGDITTGNNETATGISGITAENNETATGSGDITAENNAIKVAIELCLFVMKTQIFNDGNKRAAVIFANHYLISHGGGLIVIPENLVPEFKKLLVDYYETSDEKIKTFMLDHCWKSF